MNTEPSPKVMHARRASLHDQIIPQLRDMILHGFWQPGMPLIEAELCGHFSVSRTPLREALKVLASEGLVTLRAHRSPIVALIDPAEIADTFDVLIPLECLAGRLATERADASGREGFSRLHSEMLDAFAVRDRARYFQLNQAFHLELARLSGNAVLRSTIAGLQARIQRARATANASQARWRDASQEHEELVAALMAGQVEHVAEILRSHLLHTAEAVLSALRHGQAAYQQHIA
ncbi:GntR family transcriptional regulator [Roseomonas gilardii]|uniref:GntR family transcriptional regulator n=1 Tax=Roseomonas gilardii TaxID=257708 RepID=UPI0011A3CF73|nr:GntR family transcriptional regulator [Roseomonas gilardii]